MNFSYKYYDRNGKVLTSGSSTCFLSEADFRSYRRKKMADMPDVHYCEYYELGVSRTRMKTIANF